MEKNVNLQELNESYDEYMLTEEYLVEGLKIFKKSKRLYKFANKIDKKLIKLNDNPKKAEEVKAALKLSKQVKKLADEFKVVEDAFRDKELDKATAKSKIKNLKIHHEVLLKHVKSKQTKALLGKIGLGLLAGGLIAALGSVGIPAGLVQSVAAHAASGAGTLANAVGTTAGTVANTVGSAGSSAIGTVGRVASGAFGTIKSAVSK